MEEIKKLTKIMTGIYTINADSYRYREDCECYILVLNGEYYIAYVNPDDGYRSYASLTCLGNVLPDTVRIATTIPVDQDVYLKDVEIASEYEYADGPTQATQICNANTHETIMEIGTIYDDDYYPIGYIHYYPEELDANRKN